MRPWLAFVALVAGVLAANTCRDTAVCCQIFNFTHASAWNAPNYTTPTVAVPAGSAGPWWAQGINLTAAPYSSVLGAPYPMALFNASVLGAATPTGAADLGQLGAGYALAVFQNVPASLLRADNGAVPPVEPTITWAMAKQPACVASLYTLRSHSFSHRTSVYATTFHTDPLTAQRIQLQQRMAEWTVGDDTKPPGDHFEFTSLHVDELVVVWKGRGYGAIAAVEVCYSAPQAVDSCGVCAGNGGCTTPGNPCSTGMAGACAAGTLDDNLTCVPNLASAPEVCNGVDDNCNGLIDEGDVCPTPSLSATPSATRTPTRTASPMPTPVVSASRTAAPTPSPSPSAGPTHAPTATPAATPSATPLPRDGSIAVLAPRATCVRATDTPGLLQAVFGYVWTGRTDLVLAPDETRNWLVSADAANQPQPTLFRAGAEVQRAFQVTFADGAQVQWRLCAVDNASVVCGAAAVADRWTPACDSAAAAQLQPVQPLATGCVARVADACTATFGYINPNALDVAVPAGSGDNAFAPAPADRRQPTLFWAGVVERAFSVDFVCDTANWSLAWRLGNTTLVRDRRDLC